MSLPITLTDSIADRDDRIALRRHLQASAAHHYDD